jgi:hypothetical protein
MNDPINPAHYQGDYVMRVIENFNLGFCLGNVVKYVLRADNKGRLEDLRKAQWYLEREIQRRLPANGAVCEPPSQPDGESIADASGLEGGKL